MAAFPIDKSVKKAVAEDKMESKTEEAESLMDMSQALLHLLGNAVPSGSALLSPMLLAQAASGSLVPAAAAAQMPLPWMLPAQYQQLMVLQQGLAQQLLVPGVTEFHDGQAAVAADKAGNQLEGTAEANPVLAAILQRHSMAQRQLQKDDSEKSTSSSAVALSPNSSLLATAGLTLQNAQIEGLSTQAGLWQVGASEQPQAGILQEQQQQQQLQHQQIQQQQRPRPPKKPLTPYMIFSKEIWHQVKAANSHLSSVTEIGAIVGRLWRDLDAEKKERYNEMFNKNKIRYDEEIRVYLKKNNLRPSDLTRSRIPRRHSSPLSHGVPKLHEQTKPLALGKSQDIYSSANRDFSGQSVQQLLGQMGFAGETVFPSGVAVSDESASIGQTTNLSASTKGSEHLLNVATISPSANSAIPEKSVAWSWHQPVALANGTAGQTSMATNNKPEQLTAETSAAAAEARYYSADILDQLLKMKEPNEDKLRELAHIRELEMQILQLESALNERTQKADELRHELEAANSVIAHLKGQQEAGTSVKETVKTDAGNS